MNTKILFSRPVARFPAARDKIRRMKTPRPSRPNARKKARRPLVESERREWRVPLTEEEAEQLNTDSLDPARNRGNSKAAYVRQVLLSPLPETVPTFEAIVDPIERPEKVRVRLSPDELSAIEGAAKSLGIDAKRYARWRLLGVLS